MSDYRHQSPHQRKRAGHATSVHYQPIDPAAWSEAPYQEVEEAPPQEAAPSSQYPAEPRRSSP